MACRTQTVRKANSKLHLMRDDYYDVKDRVKPRYFSNFEPRC